MGPMAGQHARVAIVGAGPAGALLAFLLARGGVPVVLLERHSDFAREFRGEGMTPSGMQALLEAGLWAEFDALPSTALHSMALYAGGRPFLELDLAKVLPPGTELIRILAQPHLLEMLVAEASKLAGFTFRQGVLVRRPILREGRVVGLRYTDESGHEQTLHADYVVAADGRYSLLRQALGLELAGSLQAFDVVWCKVPRPQGMRQGRVYGLLLDDYFGLVFPTEGDLVQIGRIIAKGSFKRFKESGEGDWYEKIGSILPADLVPGFRAVRDQASHPFLLDVICGSLPSWNAPGICFIGDAAHPMSPVGAQGINIALRDAVVAANLLGPALASPGRPEDLDAAALALQSEREREVSKVQRLQGQGPRRLGLARRIAPLLARIPSAVMTQLVRSVLRSRNVQAFIAGTSPLRLTFGRTEVE